MSKRSRDSTENEAKIADETVISEKSPELAAALAESDWDKARLIELMDGFLEQCERMMKSETLSIKELNAITLTVARIVRERKVLIDGYYEERAPLKQEEALAADTVMVVHISSEDADILESIRNESE